MVGAFFKVSSGLSDTASQLADARSVLRVSQIIMYMHCHSQSASLFMIWAGLNLFTMSLCTWKHRATTLPCFYWQGPSKKWYITLYAVFIICCIGLHPPHSNQVTAAAAVLQGLQYTAAVGRSTLSPRCVTTRHDGLQSWQRYWWKGMLNSLTFGKYFTNLIAKDTPPMKLHCLHSVNLTV